jgi:hypothetical protein
MMKMNAGVWIGIVGGLVGLLVATGVVLAVAGPTAIYITIGMLAMFGGMFFLFYKLFFQQIFLAARLNKTGIPGKAIILEVKDTGITINNSPQVKLVLEVKDNLGQRYTTTCRALVSRLNPGIFTPGMEVPVKIDPRNQKTVVIDLSNAQGASSTRVASSVDIQNFKSELEELQKANDVIAASGSPAKAIVKEYRWLGVNVNGSNPYVELKLEILPGDKPAFEGTAKGVIHQASVNNYQPGREIFVKYDIHDNSKITIDHS